MKFTLSRDDLLKPIQVVNGVVERRQALPILGNILVSLKDGVLSLTATDMEVELIARTQLDNGTAGETTVPARKFIDICRSLPSDADIDFSVQDARAIIRSGRSRFTLSTLPAADYPASEVVGDVLRLSLAQGELKRIIDLTQFAMAHQDVRYYLNGMLFELTADRLRAVATDGHRLAMAEMALPESITLEGDAARQIIV
ncbi:MAG: DNA polymerase-3 subunit beta, partial [Gammaproteobacteria bacterium]